ncbi:XRE family transcriptional regulator [Corynebacterium kozikiae]|uniref:XRE family transcriptional regulator n=1 Tax=Corynebacterium kozikiae TaxID=2968469 RepID=UPI00211CCFA9|nr:XRE family transcriptional regulator [Corynebacterium sp. 76QC2CO]MCQ9343542.1 XRE family transcriptional regulator [Corynebacterium sp. 76QC2CO]
MRIFHSQRLKDLRHSMGMTQKEFAQHLGCTQPSLSEVENGRKENNDLIQKAVFAFKVPTSYFEASPSHYGSGALNFRTYKVPAKVQDAFASTFYEAERALLSEPSNTSIVPLVNADLNDRTTTLPLPIIEAAAIEARKRLGIPTSGPVFNVTHAIENAGHRVCTITNNFVDISRIDGASSPAFTPEGRGLIATTEKQDGGRVRFTRAHELGHLVLHTSIRPGIEKVRESEANLFAGAFLVPERDAREMFSEYLTLEGYARIKAQYAVSIAALIMRAHNLGLVSAKRYRSLFIQLSSRGWRTEEPVEIPVEISTSFSPFTPHSESSSTGEGSIISVNFGRH